MIDVGIIKISLLMAFKIPNYVRDVQILFQFKELTKILFIYKKPKEEFVLPKKCPCNCKSQFGKNNSYLQNF